MQKLEADWIESDRTILNWEIRKALRSEDLDENALEGFGRGMTKSF